VIFEKRLKTKGVLHSGTFFWDVKKLFGDYCAKSTRAIQKSIVGMYIIFPSGVLIYSSTWTQETLPEIRHKQT
jgi:hypothetical protein